MNPKFLIIAMLLLGGCGNNNSPSAPTAPKTLFSNYWQCSNGHELALYLGQYGLPFSYIYTGVLNTVPNQCAYNLTFNQDGTYNLTKGCSGNPALTPNNCRPDLTGVCTDQTGTWTLKNNILTFSGDYNVTNWAFSGVTCN
jgi:hypothetical protein